MDLAQKKLIALVYILIFTVKIIITLLTFFIVNIYTLHYKFKYENTDCNHSTLKELYFKSHFFITLFITFVLYHLFNFISVYYTYTKISELSLL